MRNVNPKQTTKLLWAVSVTQILFGRWQSLVSVTQSVANRESRGGRWNSSTL